MRCIYCNCAESKVVDSRSTDDGTVIRRRRMCVECGRRFTTYEKIEEVPFVVIKRNGSRQTFSTSKILAGIKKACEKRPIPIELQHKVADDVVRELLSTVDDQEVESSVIGEYVMRHLKELDEVAYVRFACVHRQFKDINTFMDELKVLLKEQDEIK